MQLNFKVFKNNKENKVAGFIRTFSDTAKRLPVLTRVIAYGANARFFSYF
jgi:hypothetical protein